MKRRLFVCLSYVLALSWFSSNALAVDPFFPALGNNGIDVSHYKIELDINPVTGKLNAHATLEIKAEKQLSKFTLDLHGLKINSIRVDGSLAQFVRKQDKVEIKPRVPLPANKIFVVSVTYSGAPEAVPDPTSSGKESTYLGWFKTARNSTYVVSEPVGASTFFPSNDEPNDKATYAFRVTVPYGYRGVANGTQVAAYTVGNKTSWHWEMKQPMATWLATVHVNKLKVYSLRTSKGLLVRVFYPAGVPLANAQGYAKAATMIPYFESLIGPFPFKDYGSVVVEDPALGYALETQAMSTFPSEPNPPSESSVAHELVHQWFGNSVSVARWEDLWIAEGAATYFEILWKNRKNPPAFDAAMLDNYGYVVNARLGPAVVETPTQMFTDRPYNRGAATLYALQKTVGLTTFFRIMKTFVAENRGGNVTTKDFIDTAVRVSGKASVRALLQSWVYDVGVPALPGTGSKVGAAAQMSVQKSVQKRVARPSFFGNRCGRGSHRGAPRSC